MEYVDFHIKQEDVTSFLNAVDDIFHSIRVNEFCDDCYSVAAILPPPTMTTADCLVILSCRFDKTDADYLRERLSEALSEEK